MTASNRAGMVYRLPGCTRRDARARRAARTEARTSSSSARTARRSPSGTGEELHFGPGDDGWETSGAADVLAQPNALERAWAALANPNAGELIVSAAPGVEFADLGGRDHVGGGSHGSLELGDSEVPMLSVGLGAPPARIVDVAPLRARPFRRQP